MTDIKDMIVDVIDGYLHEGFGYMEGAKETGYLYEGAVVPTEIADRIVDRLLNLRKSAVERVARALASFDREDGCFVRIDNWDVQNGMQELRPSDGDYENVEYWRTCAAVALSALDEDNEALGSLGAVFPAERGPWLSPEAHASYRELLAEAMST